MFEALVNGAIDTNGIEFDLWMGDILQLNEKAIAGELDMVKISYNTYGLVRDHYALLDAGSALGHDCGPLLIARQAITVDELVEKNALIAIPGKFTTANLLLNFFEPRLTHRKEMIFNEIMPAVLEGRADAGLIIHENRFTYQDFGLVCVQDLGKFWESQTGHPIPLGAIVAKKSLGPDRINQLNLLMRQSVAFAFKHPDHSRDFVCSHAQELEESVIQAHIKLYVNEYSLNLGDKGHAAVNRLLGEGEKMGLYEK